MTLSDLTMRALTPLTWCVNKGKRARNKWAAWTERCVCVRACVCLCAPLPSSEQSHLCAPSLSRLHQERMSGTLPRCWRTSSGPSATSPNTHAWATCLSRPSWRETTWKRESLSHTHTKGQTGRETRLYYKLTDTPTHVTWIRGHTQTLTSLWLHTDI